MKRRATFFGKKLTISLVVVVAVAVPLSVVGVGEWRRHTYLDQLGSRDLATREVALNMLIRHAPHDSRWSDGAVSRVSGLPSDAVVPVMNALRAVGLDVESGFYEAVIDELPRLADESVRSIGLRLIETDPAPQSVVIEEAIVRLERAKEADEREPWIAFLDRLRSWASPPVPVGIYVEWLARGVTAELPDVRLRTAQRLGDLPLAQPHMSPDRVTEPLRVLVNDPNPAVRVAALSAMAGYLPRHPPFLDDLKKARRDPHLSTRLWAQRLCRVWNKRELATPENVLDLGRSSRRPTDGPNDWRRILEDLDHQPTASQHVTADPKPMPHLVRIETARVAASGFPVSWLEQTLRVNHRPALRDLAALTIAQRFSNDELDPFIGDLLIDHDPDGRLSGVVLAGLTGLQTDALEAMTKNERETRLRRAARLGLWMQGRLPELDDPIVGFLERGDLPSSTVLLALMHGGQQRAALDHLLGITSPRAGDGLRPSSSPPGWLREERWAKVLDTYLPASAPRLDLHGNLAEFQDSFATLQAWHAVYRFKAWPPEPPSP